MKSACVVLLLLLAIVYPLPSLGQAIDLRVPFDRLMDEGMEAYNNGQYDSAATAFRDARLIRPESPEATLNLGLAEAKRGNLQTARDLFRQSQQYMTPEDSRRADALYNEGTTLLQEGENALQDEETASQAPEKLIEAISKFGEVLKTNPQYEGAIHNRLAAQNLLAQMEPPPPPPPPQPGENDEEEGEGDQQSDESTSESEGGENDPSEDQQQNSDSDQQQDGDQDQPQDPSQQQDGEPESDQQDQQPDQQPPSEPDATPPDDERQVEGQQATTLPDERPEEMTPEEARQLLNLLGNRELMIFRQSRQRADPPGGRDW
jgi:Ca-activated chloride channel homolog